MYAYIGTFIKYALASRMKIDNQKCAVTIELLFIGFGFPPPSNSRFYKKYQKYNKLAYRFSWPNVYIITLLNDALLKLWNFGSHFFS